MVKTQIQTKALYELYGLCRYVLSSKIVELYSQSLLFVPMFLVVTTDTFYNLNIIK